MRSRALSMVRKNMGFGQAIKMIDDLFVELKKEQQIIATSTLPPMVSQAVCSSFGGVQQVGMQRLEQFEQ